MCSVMTAEQSTYKTGHYWNSCRHPRLMFSSTVCLSLNLHLYLGYILTHTCTAHVGVEEYAMRSPTYMHFCPHCAFVASPADCAGVEEVFNNAQYAALKPAFPGIEYFFAPCRSTWRLLCLRPCCLSHELSCQSPFWWSNVPTPWDVS